MQDLKRKSDKAELDNQNNGNDPTVGLDMSGRKAWLLNEMRLMQDHYKKACVRRAKIMQYHADTLERNLHQVRPHAPTYMILGYQSACREWDRSRRNVAAYANRAAEVYVEPTREASPPATVANPAEAKPESEEAGMPGPMAVDKEKEVSSTLASQPTEKSTSNPNLEPSASTTSASKSIPKPGTGPEPVNPTGLLPSVEIIPSQNNSTFPQNNGMPAPANSYSSGQDMVPNQATQSQTPATSSQMGFGMGMDLDPSEVPTLDASEMALFDFINSVANSPTAYDPAPVTATGTVNGGETGPAQTMPSGQSGLGSGIGLGLGLGDVGSMGMRDQAGPGAGGGLDFGLLEAGLHNEIARTSGAAGQDQNQSRGHVGGNSNKDHGAAVPNGISSSVGAIPSTGAPPSSGQQPQSQPSNDQTQAQAQIQAQVQNEGQPAGGDALSLEAGTGLAELDLFSQYPDLFPMYGSNDLEDNNNNNSNAYNQSGGNNNADGNNDNNANGPNGEGEGDTGIEGFDPTQFDYSSLGEDFFMNGMQGMEGM